MDSDTKVDRDDEVMVSKKDAREDNYNGPLILQSIWDCNKMIANIKSNTVHCGHCSGKWKKYQFHQNDSTFIRDQWLAYIDLQESENTS